MYNEVQWKKNINTLKSLITIISDRKMTIYKISYIVIPSIQ